jgi:acyl carrier protein
MERFEVKSRVKQVIARVLVLKPEEIADEANFIFDLGADSMQSLQLVAAFEEEFGIEMDQDAALAVQNVAVAVDFIGKILEAKGSG